MWNGEKERSKKCIGQMFDREEILDKAAGCVV